MRGFGDGEENGFVGWWGVVGFSVGGGCCEGVGGGPGLWRGLGGKKGEGMGGWGLVDTTMRCSTIL